MAEPYFETRNLSIGYHGVPVIRDISLKIRKGEIVALIGPNGAGKSTFLKTVARELAPISGQVLLEDRPIPSYSYRELSKIMAVM